MKINSDILNFGIKKFFGSTYREYLGLTLPELIQWLRDGQKVCVFHKLPKERQRRQVTDH